MAAAIAFWAFSLSPISADTASDKKPNVILILVDDVGYGDLACHGNPIARTPNLDKLHSDSFRLTDFHVAPFCSPTRAALMTGRHCRHVGVRRMNWAENLLTVEVPTLGNLFESNGYRTGIFGKWHLGDHYPYRPQDRGFQEVVVHGNGAVGTYGDIWGNDYFDDTYWHNGNKQKYQGFCTDVWFDLAMDFIDQSKDHPFFIYLPTNAAHAPFIAPEADRRLYEGTQGDPGFFGMITNIDTNLGILMQHLDKTNLTENTILIFMSDNGTALGEKVYNAGMRGRKGSPYDGGHRVPFFIRWPGGGITGGKDVGQLSAHLDLWPTLVDLCGLKGDNRKLDGMSLVPFLSDGNNEPKPRTLAENMKGVVMTERWRLVNGEELYDIKADPSQQRDVAAHHPKVVAKLKKTLAEIQSKNDIIQRRFIVGSSKQNPVEFTPDQSLIRRNGFYQDSIYQGAREATVFPVFIEKEGNYRFELRRWPGKTGAAIRSRLSPAEKALDYRLSSEGSKALDIVSADLKVQDFYGKVAVDESMEAVTFDVPLKTGEADVIPRFFTGNGENIGVYFVTVSHLVNNP